MIARDSQSYRALALIAQSGECSYEALDVLIPQKSYQKKVMLKLLKERLITRYENDSVQGYRLARKGKELLLTLDPDRFSFYLADGADFNMRRSKLIPRLRQHRISEVLAFMENCNIKTYYDQKPQLFAAERLRAEVQSVFYLPKEIKVQQALTRKIISSRFVGVSLSDSDLWICYNMGSELPCWYENIEQRARILIPSMLNWQGISYDEASALMFGHGMEQLRLIWENPYMQVNIRNTGFQRFCYIPLDEKGQLQLKIMQAEELYEYLKKLLSEDLSKPSHASIINDGMNQNGNYTLICIDMDLKRLIQFIQQLRFLNRKGEVICFDFQAEVIEDLCGDYVKLSTVNSDVINKLYEENHE